MKFRDLLEGNIFAIYVEYKKPGDSHFYDDYIKKVHYSTADNLNKAKSDILVRIARETNRKKKDIQSYLKFEEVPF